LERSEVAKADDGAHSTGGVHSQKRFANCLAQRKGRDQKNGRCHRCREQPQIYQIKRIGPRVSDPLTEQATLHRVVVKVRPLPGHPLF
jgi:hypothetical protein